MCYCLMKKKVVFLAITSTKPYGSQNVICEREPFNPSDWYAVSVLKDDFTVGHLPRQLSWFLSLFILRNGTIDCIVTGGRRYSIDLPQGELSCKPLFSGMCKEINKHKHLHYVQVMFVFIKHISLKAKENFQKK